MHNLIQFKNLSFSLPQKNCFINFNGQINSGNRIALIGRNGSGKSTLLNLITGLITPEEGEIYFSKDLKVGYVPQIIEGFNDLSGAQRFNKALTQALALKPILNDPSILKGGDWIVPHSSEIGYLDQHYGNLSSTKSVLATIEGALQNASHLEIRKFLNDFLFRKNEEVHAKVSTLSGGEKARLSLAQIAANPPQLLILDEMTNNIDIETREHGIQVLQQYPGALNIT